MTKNQESTVSNAASGGCGCLFLLMCIGVIGAMVLPSLLNSSNKSKQSEAKQYLNAINKVQQANFVEKSAFATSIAGLEIGITTETSNYKYSVITSEEAAFSYGISQKPELKNYVGGVFVISTKTNQPNAAKNKIKTISILCETDARGTIKPAKPIYQNGNIACGKGTINFMK